MTDTIRHHALPAGIHHLEFDRPAMRNALGVAEYAALADRLQSIGGGAATAVVLSGQGASFCAGNELAEFRTAWPQPPHGPVYRFLAALQACPCPVIAAVQGGAVGVGATMLLHCDVVLAQRGAFLKYPFVDLGISVEGGSSLLLPQRLGHLRAMDLLLSARKVTAEEAAALGLVTAVVEEDVLACAMAQAQEIAAKRPEAVRAVKRQLRAASQAVLPALFEEEIQQINRLLEQQR